MRKWKRADTAAGPRFRSGLETHEAALLRNLVGSVIEMLDDRESTSPADELEAITGMRTGRSTAPEEATLSRLLPDFYRPGAGDADTAASINGALRSLHEPTIMDAKREAAQTLLRTCPAEGGRFELTEAEANQWLTAINDVRLALGVMLEISQDGPQRLPRDHPMAPHLDVYQWLTTMQEYLVLALMS